MNPGCKKIFVGKEVAHRHIVNLRLLNCADMVGCNLNGCSKSDVES